MKNYKFSVYKKMTLTLVMLFLFLSYNSNAQVTYLKTQNQKSPSGGNWVYKVYSAPSKSEALTFLKNTEVKEQGLYYVVETPNGNYAKDCIMIYAEATGGLIELGTRKHLTTPKKIEDHCAICGYYIFKAGAWPSIDIPNVDVQYSTNLETMREKGEGFICPSCGALCCAFCATLVGTDVKCPLCGKTMKIYQEK